MLPLFILSTGLKGLGIFILLGIIGSFLIYQRLPWYKKSLADYHKRKKVVQGKRYLPGLFALTIVVVLRSWTQIGVAGFLPFFYLNQHIPLRISNFYTFLFFAAGALGTFLGGRFSDRMSHKNGCYFFQCSLLYHFLGSYPMYMAGLLFLSCYYSDSLCFPLLQ